MKNCPRVECRRVSISMGAIYKAAYGTLSRRELCMGEAWLRVIFDPCALLLVLKQDIGAAGVITHKGILPIVVCQTWQTRGC